MTSLVLLGGFVALITVLARKRRNDAEYRFGQSLFRDGRSAEFNWPRARLNGWSDEQHKVRGR